ncbi:hypothetical protein MMAN_16510 [Mycobacterium mantenii]|uniref:LapA family protein n=1 Tax=Mycobacterium mantenii TaxID=560555 RepID=A0ABM7JPV5_MYCNT|nr:hypothetical protein MMAN_16510 [Mycobacterium mantenii]
MASQACARCGYESRCPDRGTWYDRHPAAAVTLTVLVLAMAVAHPWLFGGLAVGGGVYWALRERRSREAIAARADWEHRALIARQVPQLPTPVMPRRRAADHWSRTEPMRAGRM